MPIHSSSDEGTLAFKPVRTIAPRRIDKMAMAPSTGEEVATSDTLGAIPHTPQVSSSGLRRTELRKYSIKHDYDLTKSVLGVGAGGGGVRAVHRQSGQEVAVKSSQRDGMRLQKKLDLKREIDIQSSIDHPNVARVQAVYKTTQHFRMVIEHLEGGDLADYLIKRGPLSESAAKA